MDFFSRLRYKKFMTASSLSLSVFVFLCFSVSLSLSLSLNLFLYVCLSFFSYCLFLWCLSLFLWSHLLKGNVTYSELPYEATVQITDKKLWLTDRKDWNSHSYWTLPITFVWHCYQGMVIFLCSCFLEGKILIKRHGSWKHRIVKSLLVQKVHSDTWTGLTWEREAVFPYIARGFYRDS